MKCFSKQTITLHLYGRGKYALVMTSYIKFPDLLFEHSLDLLAPAMRNHTSCVQWHELSQRHCGDNREVTLL